MFVVIFPAGGREQSAEEEMDGALQGLPGREFRAFEHGGMDEAADGLEPELDCERRIDIGADLALGNAVADQAPEDIGHVALPQIVDLLVELGREPVQVVQQVRAGQVEIRADDLNEGAEFLCEIKFGIGEGGIDPVADCLSDFLMIDSMRASLLRKWR